MGRQINHQNANQQQRILQNGHESVIDGSVSDGIGRGTSRVFDVTSASASSQKVTVRRVARGSGRRIDPGSEEGRRIAAAVLSGQPAPLPPRGLHPEVSAPVSQKAPKSRASAERKALRHEIMEASRLLQGFRPKRKKKKAKSPVGKIISFNSNSDNRDQSPAGKAPESASNSVKPSVNVKKRDRLRKLIASMFGPLLPSRRR